MPLSKSPLLAAPLTSFAQVVRGKRFLLVDDDADQHYLVKRFFQAQEVQFDYVGSAEMALEYLISKEFDLIILDVMMPGMDGWELFSRLRQLPACRQTPVLFLTCVMEREHEARTFDIKSKCLTLAKPTTRTRFQRAVTQLLLI